MLVDVNHSRHYLKNEFYIEKNFYHDKQYQHIITFLDFFSLNQEFFKRQGFHFINKQQKTFLVVNCKLYRINRMVIENNNLNTDILYRKDELYFMNNYIESDFISTIQKSNDVTRYYFSTDKKVYIDFIQSKIKTPNGMFFIKQIQTSICKTETHLEIMLKTLESLNDFMNFY